MKTFWYENISIKINRFLENVIFIKDIDNLFSNTELFEYFIKKDIEIYRYNNDLILRKKLQSNKKLIVITVNEKILPYDLLNKYPFIDISLKDIFPTLDTQIFNSIDLEKLDLIYSDYINSEKKYIKKSSSETEDYLDLISLKTSKENENNNDIQEIEKKLNDLNFILENPLENLKDYFNCSYLIGEIYYLSAKNNYQIQIDNQLENIDNSFKNYVLNNYNNLGYMHEFSMSPLNSNILSSINFAENTAVICLDCMSFSEWFAIKYHLSEYGINHFEEKFSLAIIPSVTKYSRMSIFEGRNPLDSDKKNEEKAFKEYLGLLDYDQNSILFKNLREIDINYDGYDKIGLIYTFIDEIVHGSINKKMTILSVIDILNSLKFGKLISELLKNNYTIYLTSDHGNVYCKSNGINLAKQMVDEKDTRVAIYTKQNLAEEIQWDSKICLNFPTIMGSDKYIVTDIKRKNFGNRTEGLSHGGISFEEVIVPFIKIGGNK